MPDPRTSSRPLCRPRRPVNLSTSQWVLCLPLSSRTTEPTSYNQPFVSLGREPFDRKPPPLPMWGYVGGLCGGGDEEKELKTYMA